MENFKVWIYAAGIGLLLYLIKGFILAEFNPFAWSIEARMALLELWTIGLFGLLIFYLFIRW